jgi:hypothetical protein
MPNLTIYPYLFEDTKRPWHSTGSDGACGIDGQPQQAYSDADAKGPRNVGLDCQGLLVQGDVRNVGGAGTSN